MNNNPVRWFEIYVQDAARAKAFYESVFEVTLERLASPEIEMWAFPGNMDSHGATGTIVQVPGMPSGGNSTLVYFACEDCAVTEARIEPAGGRIQRPKMSVGEHGFVTLALDTEGNMIGLHSMR